MHIQHARVRLAISTDIHLVVVVIVVVVVSAGREL